MLGESLVHFENNDVSFEMRDAQYECCWRLGKWDIPAVAHSEDVGYHGSLYAALNCVNKNDLFMVNMWVEKGESTVLKEVEDLSLESSYNVYSLLGKLQVRVNTIHFFKTHGWVKSLKT